jgi:tetratricopeptide (TPR) repeat protein
LLAGMGPEDSLDQFERSRIVEIELARGTLLAGQGRWTEAVPVLEANLRRCEGIYRKSSDEWTLLHTLVEDKAALVESRLRAGLTSPAEAIAALAQIQAEADWRRLDRPSIRFQRAEILSLQAALHAEAGDLAEAGSTLDRAIAPMEAEVASHPQRLHWKLALARAVSFRGELHRRAGRGTQALADARRAVELVEPTVVEGSGYLYELGAFQAAHRGLADQLGTSAGKDAPPDLATCLGTLNKSVSDGFDDIARLRDDPRLKPLRERMKPEFDRLVAEALAAGKAPSPAETAPATTP